jgi:hypothetical protein
VQAAFAFLGIAAVVAVWTATRPTPLPDVTGIGSSGPTGPDTRPRGIRNANPLNIEYNRANDWRGQIGHDGRFVIFDDPVNGYRAAARIVDSYGRRGIETVRDIVTTWAPPVENKTSDYIAAVESISGLDADSIPNTPDKLAALFEAMTYIENGEQPYSMDTIKAGIYAA